MHSLWLLWWTSTSWLAVTASVLPGSNGSPIGQAVKTTSGLIVGHASSIAPQVSEYLGIRFAESTAGKNRFMAPVRYTGSPTSFVNASHFAAGCPERSDDLLFKVIDFVRPLAAGALSSPQPDEDCLFINVWTKPFVGEKAKGVLVWIYGGAFASGDTTIYDGSRLADTEDVIVVSMGYRTNVFGFPGAPGLPDQNLGLLDQRMAIEWVRDNIAAFGGDPSRITLGGQSAGAVSVDCYAYIWKGDPIVAGFIANSGTVHQEGPFVLPSPAARYRVWDNLATKLGCGSEGGSSKSWSCMQSKTVSQIQDAMPQTFGAQFIVGPFGPIIDDKYVFSDYEKRASKGDFIRKPMLVGSTHNESILFNILTLNTATDQELHDINYDYRCGAAKAAKSRADIDVPVWRYHYDGRWSRNSFTNLFGLGSWGATHGADVANVFGILPFGDTDQTKVFQDAWTAFVRDPANGLSRLDWPRYQPDGSSLIRINPEGAHDPDVVKSTMYDAICKERPPGSFIEGIPVEEPRQSLLRHAAVRGSRNN